MKRLLLLVPIDRRDGSHDDRMALVRAVRLAKRPADAMASQVISAGVAVLVLWLAQRVEAVVTESRRRVEPDASSMLVSWRFSLVLAVSSLGLVATTVGLVLLSIQSWQGGNLPASGPRIARHGSVGLTAAVKALVVVGLMHGSGLDPVRGPGRSGPWRWSFRTPRSRTPCSVPI